MFAVNDVVGAVMAMARALEALSSRMMGGVKANPALEELLKKQPSSSWVLSK